MRTWSYNEAFEADITGYAVVGHELLLGRALYSDIWDIKPPGIYLTYAGAELVAGYGPAAIFLLNVTAAIVTLFGVFYAAGQTGNPRAGLLAAVFWTLLSADPILQANQPNTEVFMNGTLIWAFALMVRQPGGPGSGTAIVSGLLHAVASLYKQITLATTLMLLAVDILVRRPRRRTAREAGIILATVAGVWACTSAWFGLTGRFQLFPKEVLLHGSAYAGNMAENLLDAILARPFLPQPLYFLLPYMVAAVLGIAGGIQGRNRRFWALLAAYMISVQIQIALPGKGYPHYYQLWLPPLVVGTGRLLALQEIPWLNAARRRVAAAILLAFALFCELPHYFTPIESWPVKKYGELGQTFLSSKDVAGPINAALQENETFFHWGYASGLHFWTRKSPPVSTVYFRHYFAGSAAADVTRRTMGELEKAPPEMVVASTRALAMFPESHPIIDWFLSRYERIEIAPSQHEFVFFARRGGRLEQAVLEGG